MFILLGICRSQHVFTYLAAEACVRARGTEDGCWENPSRPPGEDCGDAHTTTFSAGFEGSREMGATSLAGRMGERRGSGPHVVRFRGSCSCYGPDRKTQLAWYPACSSGGIVPCCESLLASMSCSEMP